MEIGRVSGELDNHSVARLMKILSGYGLVHSKYLAAFAGVIF